MNSFLNFSGDSVNLFVSCLLYNKINKKKKYIYLHVITTIVILSVTCRRSICYTYSICVCVCVCIIRQIFIIFIILSIMKLQIVHLCISKLQKHIVSHPSDQVLLAFFLEKCYCISYVYDKISLKLGITAF